MSEKTRDVGFKNYSLDKISDMTSMANTLRNHVEKHKLFTTISQKNYVHVDGWQFAGGMLNLYAKVVSVENLVPESKTFKIEVFEGGLKIIKDIVLRKWMAEVEIVDLKNDKVVCKGYALCSNEEIKKRLFDEYAIMSMAQTRAIGKGYRNLLGWVMKLAGYESTPAEETTDIEVVPDEQGIPALTDKDMQGIKQVLIALNLIKTVASYEKIIPRLAKAKDKWNEHQVQYVEAVVIKIRHKLGLKV